jgi:tetratricopeptide (TPR) repeat protein
MRSEWALGVALIVGLGSAFGDAVTGPSVAFAAGNDETLAAGLKKFEEGRAAYEAGQFEQALVAFKASLELLPSPNTRLYIGRCYRALGKTASAYTALKLAASEAQDRLTASGERRYSATRETANQEAADLEPKVPRLTVAVPSDTPTDFQVKVDGAELPKAAWGVATETDPGDVVVRATGHRLFPFETTVSLTEGTRARVDVRLHRVPTAIIALKLESLPAGLSLILDGQPIPVVGAETPRELDVGQHQFVAAAPGYQAFKWRKTLSDAESQLVDVKLMPNPQGGGVPSSTPKWLFFTVAAATLATAGVATGIAIHAQQQQNQQEQLDPFQRDPNVKSSIQSLAMWTDILYVGAGVLGAGAVVLAFTTGWKTPGEERTTSLEPWIGIGAAGIGAHGHF